MTTKTATIGSVSSGTMRNADLIPTFVATLAELAPSAKLLDEWNKAMDAISTLEDFGMDTSDALQEWYDSEAAQWFLDELFDALNDHAPDYCYFGAHPGNGADYGFWPSFDSIEDDSRGEHATILAIGPKDTRPEWCDVPEQYSHVLETNGHGNATLRTRDGIECWSCV